MTEQEAKILVDDTEYLISELSEEAKAQIQSIQFVDAELQRLQNLTAIMSTAKFRYQAELKKQLPFLCWALYTTPMPPRPSSRRIL